MNKLSLRLIWSIPIVAILVTFLGGCDTAMSTSKDKEPPPAIEPLTSKEALIGTWQARGSAYDDEGNVTGTRTYTLTFTKTRYIQLHTDRDSDGAIVEADWCQCESGTWDANETSVTKTLVPWDEDARDGNGWWSSDATSVARDFAFVDDERNVLLIHEWEGHDEKGASFQRYERIEDPIPGGSVDGIWTLERDYGERIERWTFTFGDSFTEHAIETAVDPSDPYVVDFIVTGSWQSETDEYFFFVTVQSHSETTNGVPIDERTRNKFAVGTELRYAYAPTGNPDEIALSPLWWEQSYDDDTSTWQYRTDQPYGFYLWRLQRESQ